MKTSFKYLILLTFSFITSAQASTVSDAEYDYQLKVARKQIESLYQDKLSGIIKNKCFDCHDSRVDHAAYAGIVSFALGWASDAFDLVGHKEDGLAKFDYADGLLGKNQEIDPFAIIQAFKGIGEGDLEMPLPSYTTVYGDKELDNFERDKFLEFAQEAEDILENFDSSFQKSSALAQASALTPETSAAQKVLNNYCVRCHDTKANDGDFGLAANLDTLINSKYVDLKNPQNSFIIAQMQGGDDAVMPPYGKKVSPQEVQAVLDWINYMAKGGTVIDPAAQPAQPQPGQNPVQFIDHTDIVENTIINDLKNFDLNKRKNLRYFTMTHLYAQGVSDDKLELFRKATEKLMNSLSWEQNIVKLENIGNEVYRFDLRELGWDRKKWEELYRAYPYKLQTSRSHGEYLSKEFRAGFGKLPYMRADWFVYEGSQPPLYHEILELPETERSLERMVGVDTFDNIRDRNVIRAGFYDSGVSQNNRMIERHEFRYGAYWKSYDFNSSEGRNDLLRNPITPFDSVRGRGKLEFTHAGGEIIFNLPNGFQAYYLATEKGQRLDRGPTDIVQDIFRKDKTVVNGISCMNCHFQGMKRNDDEIRDYALNTDGYDFLTDYVLDMYPGNSVVNRAMDIDQQLFEQASSALGISTKNQSSEPVFKFFERYEESVGLTTAATELGTDIATLTSLQGDPEFSTIIQRLGNTQFSRAAFEEVFAKIARRLRITEHRGSRPRKLR